MKGGTTKTITGRRQPDGYTILINGLNEPSSNFGRGKLCVFHFHANAQGEGNNLSISLLPPAISKQKRKLES